LREAQDWVTLPEWSLTALVTALIVGFPVSIYLAWNYERSPEGFVRTTSEQSWQNPYTTAQRKPLTSNFIIAGMALIIVGMYVYPRYLSSSEVGTADIAGGKSIAVLPLDIIGGDPEGEYFAAGVREEILNHLSLVEDLHVKSRSVVDRIGERTATTHGLVSQLQLTHYLEGSAQKVDDQIRITVQLIDAQTNDHIWSENYDRNYDNLLETQSEIAKKIANALRVTISPEVELVIDKIPTDNPQAWDDYLKAWHFLRRYINFRKLEELKKTVEFLKSSIREDPEFARGYSLLALAYTLPPQWQNIDFIRPDSILILCNQAIELDPTFVEPYFIRGDYFAYEIGDTLSALRDYNRAIDNALRLPGPPLWRALAYWKLGNFRYDQRWDVAAALKFTFQGIKVQPEPFVLAQMLQSIGWWYLEVADYQKAEYYLDKALAYDSASIPALLNKAQLYAVTGQYSQKLANAQRIIEISPINVGLFDLGMYHLLVKDYKESVHYFAKYFDEASETAGAGAVVNNHMYAYALLKLGRVKEANEKFAFVLDFLPVDFLPEDGVSYQFAKIFSALGMVDSAYYHFEKAVAGPIQWGMSDFMERDPLFENIKDEPEFQRLVGIAREKVRLKREEVRKLEESGEIPTSLDSFELY